MISKEEVKHIAKLARLELGTSSSQASTDKEIDKMQKNLSAVLDYFDLLKKADISKKKPSFTRATEEQARKDEVTSLNHDMAEKIIKLLPDKKDDYIKVKTIL